MFTTALFGFYIQIIPFKLFHKTQDIETCAHQKMNGLRRHNINKRGDTFQLQEQQEDKILPFMVTWLGLEGIMLNEIILQ